MSTHSKMTATTSDGIIIGVYGIQGVGKSYILNQISKERIEWRVVDGSQLIREVLTEREQTLEYFEKHMSPTEKAAVRKSAIESAKKKPGITLIAGHCSFPIVDDTVENSGFKFNDVFTPADGAAYDAIFYLERPTNEVLIQVQKDAERVRARYSEGVLRSWVDHEKVVLEAKCAEYHIDFEVFHLDGSRDYCDLISLIVKNIAVPASHNARLVSEQALISSIEADIPAADVYLLIDGDGTLTSQDTGTLFFDQVAIQGAPQMLKKIFKRYDHYTWQAFWEVAMLYSKILTAEQYSSICEKIGRKQVQIYDAWKTFLGGLPSNVHPILVSSSIREVWLALQSRHTESHGESYGLGQKMSIIAGNNSSHPYLVDPSAKALVANTLRKLHGGCQIIGFGNSALDVPMLCESDYAYVVVDDKMNRSMKGFLARPNQCRLSQLVDLDSEFTSKGWHNGLPVQTLEVLLDHLNTGAINSVIDCASISVTAHILAAKMRDANLKGPPLQKVHEEVGELLTGKLIDEFGKTMGLVKSVECPHVQGGVFKGLATSNVLILPLMRGGEPMARGVYSQFPSSLFVHLYDGEVDFVQRNSLLVEAFECLDSSDPLNILIIDSVINTGSSIKRAIAKIGKIAYNANPKLQLAMYVLSGVMQEDSAKLLPTQLPRVRFITLRVSENKYTGVGGSDTGNRLFGTTLFD